MAMAAMPPSAVIASTTASSSSDTQSQKMLARGVRRNRARCPMAKCGSIPMPMSPGSSCLIELRFVSRSRSSVVHCCPIALTYWRSSSQMAQAPGGSSLSACCVPQVVQMK
jgi:hypothetical protein